MRGVGSGPSEDGESLDDVLQIMFEGEGGSGGGGGDGPRSLSALAVKVARLGREDGVRAGFAKKRAGPVVLRTPQLLITGRANVPVRVRGAGRPPSP